MAAASGVEGRRMEGWLYLIRSNRLGLQYSRKRYFVLQDNSLNCFKSVPSSINEEPIRSAVIDSCIRVTDDGRENIHKNVFFIFTLYNSSNHSDQLKLGARSSEEVARWIDSLMRAVLECPNKGENLAVHTRRRRSRSLRLKRSKGRSRILSSDWTMLSSVHMDQLASDVIAPSPWTIFGCKNGLRLFKEANDFNIHGKYWNDHPAIMAVGVVDAAPEAIFQTIMSLGPSRSEWDFCFSQGVLVEHLDGHTDIIHKKLTNDWFPWGMKRRDLLLRRYWRREDDGTYVILYHSVVHQQCRPVRGYVRACLKSGGYVISPVKQGKQSVVKHMLAIDWRFWLLYALPSLAKHITIRMLTRVAALRELYRAKPGNVLCSDELSSGELSRDIGLPEIRKDDCNPVEVQPLSQKCELRDPTEESIVSPTKHGHVGGSFVQLNDAADEFFDVLDESEYEHSDNVLQSNDSLQSQGQRPAKLSAAAVFVKRLQELAAQKRGYADLQDSSVSGTMQRCCGATLQNDPSCSIMCSWAEADPSTFLIRSETYLRDRRKIKSGNTLMRMVAADWLNSDKREDDLGGRSGGIVQKHALKGGKEFFFIVNIQVPGSTTYNLALYYMMDSHLESVPLLQKFVDGDDAFRNSRFKLIPYISKGSWIVKQSVGKKACLLGQALEINYFRGRSYIELDVDIGSSTVARGVVSLVLGYLSNLVIEMAFLIQGNTEEELPEFLLGTCRLNYLDASKSVTIT